MKSIDKYNEILSRAGLSESERTVYMAGLEQGISISSDFVKALSMPRPTVLAALQELQEFGLCKISRRDGRSYFYQMMPPINLKSNVGKRIRELEDVMEDLESVNIDNGKDMLFHEVEGTDGLENLLELALRCKSRRWQIIAPRKNALNFMPNSYIEYFKRVRSERQIESQSLWELKSKQDIPLRDVLMRKPRYVPDSLGKTIPCLMLAFDDSLLIVNMSKNDKVSAVLIQDTSVTKTFQIIFEMAWLSAR